MKILTDPRSGSYQGITSSRNRFGQYVRTRAIPVQPRTPKQTANRAFLTSASSQWRNLSDALRTAWNDYAAQLARTDSLGSSYAPTGASAFAGAAIAGQSIGPNFGPPSVLPSYVLSVESVTYTDPTPGPEAFTFSLGTTDANNIVLVETSGPVSPGLTSAASVRRWRSLPVQSANLNAKQFSMAISPVPMLVPYNFLFPSPTPGQVIWFRFNELFNDGSSNAFIANKLKITFRFIAT